MLVPESASTTQLSETRGRSGSGDGWSNNAKESQATTLTLPNISSRTSQRTITSDVERHDSQFEFRQAALSSEPDLELKKTEKEQKDPNLVEFTDFADPDNPKNWSKKRRWAITMSGGMMSFVVTFSSSIFSVAIPQVSKEFHIGDVTATLGVSLFLLGFVFGPIMWGPASELFGRLRPLMIGFWIFVIFQVPVGVATNVETIMLARFIAGFTASAPLTIYGGVIADIWDPIDRAYGICVFGIAGFAGPVFGPVIGGFIVQSHLGWRWTAWITLIMAAFFGLIGCLVVPETSVSRILQSRATRLRYETGNWALHAKADENQLTGRTILTKYLTRPFIMIVQEPILALFTAYLSFIYGILYLFFEAFPISFQQDRGWNPGVGSLPFLSYAIGIGLGAIGIAVSTATNFKKSYVKYGVVIPEERLPPMIVGGILLPVALFWFAWTSNPHIIWVPQVLSCALLGGSSMAAFWQGISYIIDCYGTAYSASAISVNTFARSIVGAVFPLFATAMYHRLGVAWASSILGFLCVVFAPVPILFYIYGARIRAKSKYAPM